MYFIILLKCFDYIFYYITFNISIYQSIRSIHTRGVNCKPVKESNGFAIRSFKNV